MLAHPEILLLRVEGHADELGGSAYNLELSQKRAGFVVDELVRLGVARSRLQAVGSGEAVPTSDARRVHFLVLVWDDTYTTPVLPPLTPPSPGKTPPATRGKLSPNLPVAPPAPR